MLFSSVLSLRRHYPDQVQTVGSDSRLPSQPGFPKLPPEQVLFSLSAKFNTRKPVSQTNLSNVSVQSCRQQVGENIVVLPEAETSPRSSRGVCRGAWPCAPTVFGDDMLTCTQTDQFLTVEVKRPGTKSGRLGAELGKHKGCPNDFGTETACNKTLPWLVLVWQRCNWQDKIPS